MRFTTFFRPKNTSDNNQQTDNNQQAGTESQKNISANDSQEGTATSETDNKGQNEGEVNATYNLIILDESGSMSGVRRQTVSGCNETLNGIRSTAKKDTEIKQFVSIYCFDTSNSRYLFKNMPIEEVRDLTYEDYCPNACTPLYDAVGYTVTELKKVLENTPDVGKVTIITDGMENASHRWNYRAVVELIGCLKKQGWLFTFIGANIDVEGTAKGLGIDSYLAFEQTEEGMSDMFESERRSQRAYSGKMGWMKRRKIFSAMQANEQREMMGSLNRNYFIDKRRVAPNNISHLGMDEVFVFGSNVQGTHNGGSARYAVEHFGAIVGQAEGMQGQSYAIPTVGCSLDELKEAVERFTDYAVMHPDKKFILTAIGCGAAGYTPEQIAPLFNQAYSFGNVFVPASFIPYMEDDSAF